MSGWKLPQSLHCPFSEHDTTAALNPSLSVTWESEIYQAETSVHLEPMPFGLLSYLGLIAYKQFQPGSCFYSQLWICTYLRTCKSPTDKEEEKEKCAGQE